MKRFSLRPVSHHGSENSSIGPDTPSIFSHGSSAPMLSTDGSRPQLPPNKLVKRGTTPVVEKVQGTLSRRGTTLRRPATSHQRSATLHSFQEAGGFTGPPQAETFSLDKQLLPAAVIAPSVVEAGHPQSEQSGWASFFQPRGTKGSDMTRRMSDSPSTMLGPNKRVQLPSGGKPRVFLIRANVLTGSKVPPGKRDATTSSQGSYTQLVRDDSPRSSEPKNASASSGGVTDETPAKRARRSMSMHLSSPTTWITRTGSIRRLKRGSTEATLSGDQRSVSDPTHNSAKPSVVNKAAASRPGSAALDQTFMPYEPRQQQLESEPAASEYQPKTRKRNSSSPLPPLSRLSSFNIDVSRLGLHSAASSGPRRSPHMPVPSSGSAHSHLSMSQSRAVSGEGASTVVSSDLENHFTSGDDEDADERSDTMYDSFRTGASARLRSIETPLESMFDDSPPGSAEPGNNNKTSRLSIQEILGRPWHEDTDIKEEEESIPTPVRASHSVTEQNGAYSFERASLDSTQRDLARFSLDDDDDDDWAREEDITLSNHLSPPNSSLNSRRASPMLRNALSTITAGERYLDRPLERPRSNIFDWVEPTSHEVDGYSARPKTMHGKQELDPRGSRFADRKGLRPIHHVRSQSVPVVPDIVTDSTKVVPKFGTWGMGTKTVSEDWDDDFDLDEEALDGPVEGKDSATSFSLVVPQQIQTIQNTVKAHSGQIRELSLLVNDLKRLCRHGRDLDIRDGPSAAKWREAENIIELAAPDDDDEDDEPAPVEEPLTPEFDASSIEDRFLDEGFDAESLEHKPSFASLSVHSGDMSRTAVVRERQAVRRRSVFSPEDDIFGGNWPLAPEEVLSSRPRTPEQWETPCRDSAMISTVMEAMQQQRSAADTIRRRSPVRPSQSKLFFDTNSLQELVKRASHLRDSLSDLVRNAESLTQSPAGTPQRDQRSRLGNGSPAFTRVFTEPPTSPPRRILKSHSASTVISRTSVDSPRLQMMTVS